MKSKRTQKEKLTRSVIQVVGITDPQDFPADSEIVVEIGSFSQGTVLAGPIRPDNSGSFVLQLKNVPELEQLLRSGDLEVRVLDRDKRVLGREGLKAVTGQTLIGMKLHSIKREPGKESEPKAAEVGKIFPQRAISYLASRVAKIQGVDTQRAQAPRPVLKAIAELNNVGQLAARILAGEREAEWTLRLTLGETVVSNPGGAPGWPGNLAASILTTVTNFEADGFPALGCGPVITRGIDILKAGFAMDFQDRNRDARWTRMARAYVSPRLQTVSSYVGSIESALRDLSAQLLGYPVGDEGLMEPILQPDIPLMHVPEPYPDELGNICELVAEMCMSLIERAASEYLQGDGDPTGSVEPNCLCYGYDPNQVFIVRPRSDSDFPVVITPRGMQLAPGINLFFNRQNITNSIIQVIQNPITNQYEIHFRMPQQYYNQSGAISLTDRDPIVGGVDHRVIEAACGVSLPDLPDITFPISPAFISVIYPPVIESFSARGIPDEWPVGPCVAPMELCWQVGLADGSLIGYHDRCLGINVLIRDNGGPYIQLGGSSGCTKVNIDSERTYVIEATSYAGQQLCGAANPQSLLVRPIHHLRLLRYGRFGMEIPAETNGAFIIEVSCPAPEGGLEVFLHSSDPRHLEVPSRIIIPANETQVQVEFRTGNPERYSIFCGLVTITAEANDHLPSQLQYEVYKAPVLAWEYGPRSHRAFSEITPLDVFLFTMECVPKPLSRIQWRLVRTDSDGRLEELIPTIEDTYSSSGSYLTLSLTLSDEEAQKLTAGRWSLWAEIPDRNVVSNRLEFDVFPCRSEITLESVTVVEGQEELFEGDLELAVTTTIDGTSRRWPDEGFQSVAQGSENKVNLHLPIAIVEFKDSPERTVDITAQIEEEDTFLLGSNEFASQRIIFDLKCDEVSKILQWILLDPENIRPRGGTSVTVVSHGERRPSDLDLPDTSRGIAIGDGLVALVFRAIPL